MDASVVQVAVYALVGLAVSTGFLLALFVGFLVVAGLSKHSGRTPQSAVVRNIYERLGTRADYLPPTAPRGPVDQLRTPELNEQNARNS